MREIAPHQSLRRLLRPQARIIVIVVLLIVAGTLLGIAPAFVGGHIVDALVAGSPSHVLPEAGKLLAVVVFGAFLDSLRGYLVNLGAERYGRSLRGLIYRTMLRLPLPFFRERAPGELINRADSDVDALISTAISSVEPTISAAFGIVLTLVVMLSVDWRLSVVAVVTIPIWALASRPAAAKLSDLRLLMMRSRDAVSSCSAETLTYAAAAVIKNANAYAEEGARFERAYVKVMDARLHAAALGKLLQFVLTATAGLGPVLVLIGGAFLVSRHQTTIGTLVAFLNLQGRLYGPAAQLANVNLQIATARAVLARIREVLSIDVESDGSQMYADCTLQANDVMFTSGLRTVLPPASFTAPLGARVAVVGESGSGKSTLAALLVRNAEPTGGSLTLGGVPLDRLPLARLRREIVLAPQTPVFFARSIRDNLSLGQSLANERIEHALDVVGAGRLIAALPAGLDTVLDAAVKLSGGEQQRLALARALLTDARVLVLDEATSALDAEAEAAVLGAVDAFCRDRTLIFITHHRERLPRVDLVVHVNSVQARAELERV